MAVALSCSLGARRLLSSFRARIAAAHLRGMPALMASSRACCSGPNDPSLAAWAVAATNARAYATMLFSAWAELPAFSTSETEAAVASVSSDILVSTGAVGWLSCFGDGGATGNEVATSSPGSFRQRMPSIRIR